MFGGLYEVPMSNLYQKDLEAIDAKHKEDKKADSTYEPKGNRSNNVKNQEQQKMTRKTPKAVLNAMDRCYPLPNVLNIKTKKVRFGQVSIIPITKTN